eukprot:g19881.t1
MLVAIVERYYRNASSQRSRLHRLALNASQRARWKLIQSPRVSVASRRAPSLYMFSAKGCPSAWSEVSAASQRAPIHKFKGTRLSLDCFLSRCTWGWSEFISRRYSYRLCMMFV